MSKVRLYGSSSGFVELQAPAVAGDVTVTIPNEGIASTVGFRYVGTRYYTSDGTFVKADPFGDLSFDGAKLRAIKVRVQGAGGGGGGAAATTGSEGAVGGPGGGGAYGEAFVTDIAGLATSVTVTRGGGGNGGAAGANAGSAGGQSAFGSITANGGAGGNGGSASAGSGFTGAGAGSSTTANVDLTVGGQSGVASWRNGTTVSANVGGSSFFGKGAVGVFFNASSATGGAPGQGFGSAGSGGVGVGAAAQTGGSGANGIVIIDVFA